MRMHVVFNIGDRPGRAYIRGQRHGDVGTFFGKNAQTFSTGKDHQQIGTIEGIGADQGVAREVGHRNDLACGTDRIGCFV